VNAAALVIVLVGAGEAGSDWAAGTLQALREALDRRVVIELREDLGSDVPESAYVVEVDFGKGARRARLTCTQPGGRDRKELEFKKGDRPLDRGRAIGYALGALLPELRADAPPPPAVEPAPAPAPAPPPAAEAPPPPAPVEATPPAPGPGRLGLEATGFVESSFVSSQPAVGGALALELRTLEWLFVRAGAGGAFGNSPLPAEASLREVAMRVGLRAALLRPTWAQLSLLAHGMLVQLVMERRGATQQTWRGAAELSLELAFTPSRYVALFLKPTARTTFGAIPIYVNDQRAAAITPFAFAVELGVRVWP